MKFSEQWLREWVNPDVTTDQLSHQLTMSGLEVDAIELAAPEFEGVVIGEVDAIDAHPEADRLQVCKVNVAGDELLQIVCGASNVAVGMRVPVACVGAVLPGGMKIKRAKLRGVESLGMLCSAKEIGVAESADGLMPLPGDAPLGKNIRDYLNLDDVTIELGLTPNRSDCLSIAGVARETGVLYRCAVSELEVDAVAPTIDDSLSVTVQATDACPRYLGRVIRGISHNVETPLWMQERLRRSGVRSIAPVVDVTNYVLLELGQPMHAFDHATLSGGIDVRYAKQGEKLTLLDGQEVELDDSTLVIADTNGPLALAGIMGGQASSVTDKTDTLFLESAFFSPKAISGKARGYGLHTDSSHRYERGVDYDLPRKAMERASSLLLDIVGGEAGPIIEVVEQSALPNHQVITLRASRIKRLLGVEIAEDEVTDILTRLGMQVSAPENGQWQVVSPSFRYDIEIEVDLIEEVARIHGYSALPDSYSAGEVRLEAGRNKSRAMLQALRRSLTSRGYQEAVTYSFVDPELQQRLDPLTKAIELANPISADMAVMRTSLWPGLVETLRYNLNRQQKNLKLFETGVKFSYQGADIKEEKVISGIVTGNRNPEQWGQKETLCDFFDVKNDVEALLTIAGKSEHFSFIQGEHPVLHPGQTAKIMQGTEQIGWIGALHPQLTAELSIDGDVFIYELQQQALMATEVVSYQPLSKFPAIRRDLAVIVAEDIPAAKLEQCIYDAAGELLTGLQVFDVYQGKGIESGAKSLAISLTLQDFSRTLKDDEVESVVGKVLQALDSKLGATLRD